ncbi:AIPR family protein [Coleofasciculus sp. FACHB-SPT36]|uniref:AIPR family protein n=1 Tax=Cyanophyceae TaxID=3028117 RepID=UPI00168BC2D5|nr:AIPR family protein [Coleofasciculus sp. FACHB-SPT36]
MFDKDIAYQAAVENANRLNIEAEFNLSNWGKIDDPHTAFYGQINALELAELWLKHKNKLFAKNLRDFIDQTQANDEIIRTIKEEPSLFWYFNNGVTVLCQELQKKTKGTKRLSDDFFAKGISIINGAQTIGSIGRAYEDDPEDLEEKLEEAQIFIRLISLEKCSDDFGMKITKATNTQNTVESRDFVALDPTQQRLAQELKAWDKDKIYFYKRSAEMVSNENSCTLSEATIALACFNPDLGLSVIAKKDISEIWGDTSSTLYKIIFNNSISSIQLWRVVEVYRIVENELKVRSKESKSFDKIANHANLFILHLVFQSLEEQKINIFNPDFKAEDYELFLPKIITNITNAVHEFMQKEHPSTRIGIFFKSNNKCQELKQKIYNRYK